MPAGRPSLYDPLYCERVVELAGEGMSLVEIACELGVVRQTLYDWEKVHPEFLGALTRARQVCQAWWERQGRAGLATQGFNASLWSKNVSCRFRDDWTDKSQHEHSGPNGGPIPTTIQIVGVEPE